MPAMTESMPLEELERLLSMVWTFSRRCPHWICVRSPPALLQGAWVAGQTMMVGPQEHAARVMVLLTGRVQLYEPTPSGQSLTVSVTESGTVVEVGASRHARGGCACVYLLFLLQRKNCRLDLTSSEGPGRNAPALC